MTPEEAEAILALEAEVSTAQSLADDARSRHDDWHLRYAAERIIERIFQAAQALPDEYQ